MNQLVLIFPLLLSGPNIPETHIQRINYPTHRACIQALAHQNPRLIDKDFSFCKPIIGDSTYVPALSEQYLRAIEAQNNRPASAYHD